MKSHCMSRRPEYHCWKEMRARCSRKTQKDYPNYGGRGISVCERWQSFENFISDMGFRPSAKHSLDRIDNEGGYNPKNCRWVLRKIQNRNKRNNRFIKYKGKSLTVNDWALILGMDRMTLKYRIQKWGIEHAFNQPIKNGQKFVNKIRQRATGSTGA